MKLKDLRAKGAFVKTGLVEKRIEWTDHVDEETGEPDPINFTVQIRRQSFGIVNRALSSGVDVAAATFISECVVFDGNEVLSPAEVFGLHPTLAQLLIQAINEVNRPRDKAEVKNLAPPTSSGTT